MSTSKQHFRAIICDVDKTLTSHNTWLHLTEELGGDVQRHIELFKDFRAKKMTYDESKKELFKMLEKAHGGKIHKKKIQEIFFKVPLVGEAFATFGDLKKLGFQLCLVSSSIDLFVQNVAERLQIPHWYANNKLIFDENGYWVDISYRPDEAQFKLEQVEDFLKRLNTPDGQPFVIGDDEGDLMLFERFKGIAMNSDVEALKQVAWKEVQFLPAVIQLLQPFS